jgi:translation elongation factor EF-G
MKTIEERLKSKGITKKTKHHSYDYLYKSIVELMQEYEDELKEKEPDEKITSAIKKVTRNRNFRYT